MSTKKKSWVWYKTGHLIIKNSSRCQKEKSCQNLKLGEDQSKSNLFTFALKKSNLYTPLIVELFFNQSRRFIVILVAKNKSSGYVNFNYSTSITVKKIKIYSPSIIYLRHNNVD